jgi:hypothetical protein
MDERRVNTQRGRTLRWSRKIVPIWHDLRRLTAGPDLARNNADQWLCCQKKRTYESVSLFTKDTLTGDSQD